MPKLQFFDASGRTLAFGCIFSYKSGTSTPLATYTDSTGTVQNTNPVILDAGGFAGSGSSGIWLAAGQAYTLKVKSSGGSNCASGSTLYSVDGIGGGVTLLTTVSTCTGSCTVAISAQFQLFKITLTGNSVASPLTAVGITPPAFVVFEITQDSAGGHSWTWPSNSVGGCTIGSGVNQTTMQEFVWDGTTATAIGPCVTGNGPKLGTGEIDATGNIQTILQLISTVATGTPPLVVSSTTQVANLNVSQLEGKTWEVPGTIGSTTPNTGAFTSFVLNGSAAQTAIQGTPDTKLLAAGTVAGTAAPLCTDANGGATTTGCLPGSVTGNGYLTIGTTIIEWGTTGAFGTGASTGTVTGSFPLTFPNNVFTITATPDHASNSGSNQWGWVTVNTLSTSGFTMTLSAQSASNITDVVHARWIAIGN